VAEDLMYLLEFYSMFLFNFVVPMADFMTRNVGEEIRHFNIFSKKILHEENTVFFK
jgi:hypothetical protein